MNKSKLLKKIYMQHTRTSPAKWRTQNCSRALRSSPHTSLWCGASLYTDDAKPESDPRGTMHCSSSVFVTVTMKSKQSWLLQGVRVGGKGNRETTTAHTTWGNYIAVRTLERQCRPARQDTDTKMHRYTDTQIHRYTNTQHRSELTLYNTTEWREWAQTWRMPSRLYS